MTRTLLRPPGPHETRGPEQLWEQYFVEKELAVKLRQASKTERRSLYSSAYDELYKRIPHHSQLTYKASAEDRVRRIGLQMSLLKTFLNKETVFLEVGAGDCALSLTVADKVARVYALDVSASISQNDSVPPNFSLVLSDGTSVPLPAGTVTVAYSNQLMEHLHPDDALQQLRNIHEALAAGGVYICLTPNRLTGPHDISRYFDTTATGFHLKEYSCGELVDIFRRAGFRSMKQCLRWRSTYVSIPTVVTRCMEFILECFPDKFRRRAAGARLARGMLEIRLIATK